MIDSIINSIVETASPAITRWRTAFLIVCLLFVSPKTDKLFALDIESASLAECLSLFAELLSSSVAVIALLVAICFYMVAPYVNYLLLSYLTRKSIPSSKPLLDKVDELRAKDKNDIEKIIEESFDDQEIKAKHSIQLVDKYRLHTELAIMMLFFYMVASLHLHVFNLYVFAASILFYVFICFRSARLILLVYLRDVAPFRVLQDYVKYFVLVK